MGSQGADPGYCAISYYAGDPRDNTTIFVNGVKFNVFANLEHALRQLLDAFRRGELSDKPRLF